MEVFTKEEVKKQKVYLQNLAAGVDPAASAEALYKIFGPLIRGKARAVSYRLAPVLDDILQDVMLRVIERSKSFDPKHNPNSWIMSITKNLCIDHLRKSRVRVTEDLSDDLQAMIGMSLWKKDSPVERLSSKEVKEAVDRQIEKLSPPKKEAIRLFYFDDLSIPEIVRATGRRAGSITNATSLGRAQMRETELKKFE